MTASTGSLLFSATLKDAASLRAVLDLVDKDFSQDAGNYKLGAMHYQLQQQESRLKHLKLSCNGSKFLLKHMMIAVGLMSLWY